MTILIAENDDAYFAELQKGFASLPVRYYVQRVKNGKLLLQFLSGLIEYQVKLPDILLLELNEPVTDEFKTIELIKVNSYISNIPIIIYTSSVNKELNMKCLASGADLVLKKGRTEAELESFAFRIQDFINKPESVRVNIN